MNKIIIIICGVFLFSVNAQAETVTLTLEEAIAIALRDNRDILLKEEDLKDAKSKLKEAHAGLFPTLNFTASYKDTRAYYNKNLSETATQTTLKQYLYKGGAIINTIKYEGKNIKVAKALLDKEKLELIKDVKKNFYTLYLTKDFVKLNKAIMQNNQDQLVSYKERYDNGEVSYSDIFEIDAALSNAKNVYGESFNQIEASELLLKDLLAIDINLKIDLVDEFKYQPIELAYDEAFLKAVESRPEIAQYEAQIKADKLAVEIAKATNRPNIYAAWDYYSRSRTSLSFAPTKGWQDYNVLGLVFTWPIFDGWATRAKVEQAIVDLKQTQLTQMQIKEDIVIELKNAYIGLKDAISKLDVTDSDLVRYSDNLNVAIARYAEGEISHLDRDDAILKYEVASFNKKDAIYDYLIAKSNFERATGGM